MTGPNGPLMAGGIVLGGRNVAGRSGVSKTE